VSHAEESLQTFSTAGSSGWYCIANLRRPYRDVLLRHFPHCVALTESHVGSAFWEVLGNYLGTRVFHVAQENPGLYTPTLPF
jgi:hypothetical protein